jgi:putative aminopeptidase FrvX
MKKEYEILKKLSLLPGVPGNEKQVSQFIKEKLCIMLIKLTYDNLGSVNY